VHATGITSEDGELAAQSGGSKTAAYLALGRVRAEVVPGNVIDASCTADH